MKFMIEKDKMMSLALALFVVYAAMLVPADAWAFQAGAGAGGQPTGITNVLCTVVDWFTGTIGKAIATLAIIVIGIGALMGKVSWGMAIIVGLGVGVVFGAGNIVDVLGGTGSC